MGLFSKRRDDAAPAPLTGRAVIARGAGSFASGYDSEGNTNMNNFSATAKVGLPVRVDPTTRRIVAIDDATLEAELAPWKDMAADVWKRTEGPLRDAYAVGELGRFAKEELPGIAIECQFRMGVMTAEDLAELRGIAGTPGFA